MSNPIFSFDDLSKKDQALKQLQKLFKKAGAEAIDISISDRIKRTAGINYREVSLTFADSQVLIMRIKRPGDIYQIRLNGRELPIKSQDDQKVAVDEIVARLDAGRSAFQKRLAKATVVIPKGVGISRKTREQALIIKRDSLIETIAEVRGEAEKIRTAVVAHD
jgi:hypothetical protein